MNVNPFSYLIEKLKGKVDKSGDTMTGELKVDTGTSTDSIVSIGGSQNYGALRLKAGTTGKQGTIITASLTANRNYILPNNGGTLALTSDIPNSAKIIQYQKIDNVSSATFQVPSVDRGVFMIVNRLGILVISENTSGAIEQLTPLGNITYTDNGSNSITVNNAQYFRGVSLIQLC